MKAYNNVKSGMNPSIISISLKMRHINLLSPLCWPTGMCTRPSKLRPRLDETRDVQNFVWDETETRRCSFRDAGRDLEDPETLKCHAGYYRSNCSYSMHGARLHKTSRRHAIVHEPRRDLLGWDQDISLRDREETLRILSETRPQYVSRPLRRLDQDHIPADQS